MTIFMKSLCALSCIAALSGAFGFEQKALAADYDYPELLVTPRASERLDMEAKKEADSKWTRNIPVQISGATTLLAGLIQFGNVDSTDTTKKSSPWAGVAVGGGWLAATAILSAYYSPYGTMVSEIKSLPAKTQREQLVRERMAEEAIENAAAVGRRITWLSVLTNFGASAFMLGTAQSGSFAKVTDAVAMAAAFTPLLFPYRWQAVAQDQRDYKKRIYSPLASFTVLPEGSTGHVAPGVALSLAF